jgi:hypothetical protein
MPGNPKECREHAKNCYRLAANAHTQAAKERFEELARTWLALAADLDAAQSLLDVWGEPIEPSLNPPTRQRRRSFRKDAYRNR